MKTLKGLVLQGGGALGAYQYGAITALNEKSLSQTGHAWMPDVITGVSIGAVNAVVFLGGKDGGVQSLQKLWEAFKYLPNPLLPQAWQAKASKMGVPNAFTLNPKLFWDPINAKSLYDLSPFRRLLTDLVDFDKINNHPTELIIEAVNVETGEPKRFSNHKDGITLDIVFACMGIPPNFPYVKVDDNYYWDGGLYANLPLSPAINYLENIGTMEDKREITIMTLFSKSSPLPTSMQEMMDRMYEIIFESKMSLDKKMYDQMNAQIELYHQIDKALPQNSPIRQAPAFQKMLEHKTIDKLTLLQYTGEGVAGTDDFTPDAIDARYRAGHRDATEQSN